MNKTLLQLKYWFVFHFIVDLIFAVPLILFPHQTLMLFGWTVIDPLTARLVGAALMGIGVESYLCRHSSLEHFSQMLRLKIIWSISANLGIALSIFQGAPLAAWLFQVIFLFFSCVWIYFKINLKDCSKSTSN